MGKISYSAVVLDDESHGRLVNHFASVIPQGWVNFAHHMTINMGEIDVQFEKYLGMKVDLDVTHIGIDDAVMAVGVSVIGVDKLTTNKIPHITLAVDRANGGKPFHSNKITNWRPISFSVKLSGKVEEVEY